MNELSNAVDLEATILFRPPAAADADSRAAIADVPVRALPASWSGANVLVARASALLQLTCTLRRSSHHDDPATLRDHLVQAVTDFEAQVRLAGEQPDQALIARYVLCTVIDEAVAQTPWGNDPEWVRRGLLVTLHREGFGGSKFFMLLERALEEPARHIDLLELMCFCLALGFEGRYRVLSNGRFQLDALRNRLHAAIRRERGPTDGPLSGKWRAAAAPAPRVPARGRRWATLAGMALLLAAGYAGLSWTISSKAASVVGVLESIDLSPRPGDAVAIERSAPGLRLRALLEPERLAGLLDVDEDARSSHVVLHADTFYDPGSARFRPAWQPLLKRIAGALARVPGRVVVRGHADDVPIHAAGPFESNQGLSLERARGVATVLAESVAVDRIDVQGAGSSEPLDPHPTAAARARNRRVEITVRSDR